MPVWRLPVACLVALAIGFFGLSARAGDEGAEVAARLRDRALAGSAAWDMVQRLTTEIGPRLVGTPHEARAVDWAVRELKGLGFDKVWTEEFPAPVWIRGVEEAAVVAPFPQPLHVTALGGSVATPPAGIEAEAVLFDSYAAMLAAPAGSLAGRIAVVLQPMARSSDGLSYGAMNPVRRSGPSEAARRGARAFLMRSLGTDSHRLPHTGQLDYAADAPRIPAAALSVPDAEQLARIAAKGGPVRLRLRLEPVQAETTTSRNVLAELTGRERPDEIVAIGAHLDSWDLGTGAVDDGAGVAIVATAASLLRDLPRRPRRTIRVILFAAEESGAHGAVAYADRQEAAGLARHVMVAESDFGAGRVLRFSTFVNPAATARFQTLLPLLAPLGIAAGDNAAFGGPDMAVLRARGVPVFGLQQDGRDYFDVHHTADDTLDKIDRASLDQNVAAWAVTLWWMAEALDPAGLRPLPPSAPPRPVSVQPEPPLPGPVGARP